MGEEASLFDKDDFDTTAGGDERATSSASSTAGEDVPESADPSIDTVLMDPTEITEAQYARHHDRWDESLHQ